VKTFLQFIFILLFVLNFFHCKKEKPDKALPNSGINPKSEIRSGTVAVSITFQNHGLDLPMKIFELSAGRLPELWETRVVSDSSDAPISFEIADNILYMSPGSKKTFVLVLKNPSTETIYFFASPHEVFPPESSLGFKFKCLCINHAFSVPPSRIWYRVVQLNLDKGFRGDKMEIKHSLIRVSEERAGEFEFTQH